MGVNILMVFQGCESEADAHRSKEKGDDNEPDDVILEGDEGLLEA